MPLALEGAKRKDVLVVPVELIEIPEEGDPLYDIRSTQPIDDTFVDDIARNDYMQNIGGRKTDDGKMKLIWGRRRVMAFPRVQARRAELGLPPLRGIPCDVRKGHDEDLFLLTISENQHRQEDRLLNRARKAERAISFGHSNESIAASFGVKRWATVQGWIKLLSLDAATLQKIESGAISEAAAMALAHLTEEERGETIAEAEAEGKPVSTARAREAVSKKKGKGRASAARKKLCEAAVAFARKDDKDTRGALRVAAEAYAATQKKSRREGKKGGSS